MKNGEKVKIPIFSKNKSLINLIFHTYKSYHIQIKRKKLEIDCELITHWLTKFNLI